MPAIPNDSTSLTLAEEGGGTLVLKERALPYMPLSITGTQRAEFVWYPGSPQATVQMLGPEEGVITLRGFWKDKFIEGTDSAQYYQSADILRRAQAGGFTDGTISNVVELVKIVDTMRRMGKRITLSWDRLQRIGHITSFTQTWQTTHYCEWELEFSVVAQEETSITSATPNKPDASASAVQAYQWTQTVPAAFNAPKPAVLSPYGPFNDAVLQYQRAVDAAAASFASVAQQVTNQYQAYPNTARAIIAATTGVIAQTSLIIGTFLDGALTETFAVLAVISPLLPPTFGETDQLREDNLPFGLQVGGASYQRNFKTSLQQILTSNAIIRHDYQRQMQSDNVQTVTTKANTDLRDISQQYYGNSTYWTQLMLYNGLNSSKLSAGAVIFVPQNPASLGAGLTQGGSY